MNVTNSKETQFYFCFDISRMRASYAFLIRHCVWWNFGENSDVRSKVCGNCLVVRLTRGGRGTGMGGGPRWRRCCTGGGMFCCRRRRWWICRISTDLACLLQHLVYGVHVCPHGIKRHSNAEKRTDRTVLGFMIRALNQCSQFAHIDLSSSSLFFLFSFAFDINDKK